MNKPDLLIAFSRVREAAEHYMDERDRANLGWVEEAVTDATVHKGLPEVQVVQFNRNQEGGGVGADYLWWWIDQSSGECFGMLVQAKRLHHQGARWTVDIRHRDGKQRSDLLGTANHFEVPAMYSVYTGGQVFRKDLPCPHEKATNCPGCRRMAISLISAYQLSAVWSPVDTAALVLNEAIPLEDLVDPALAAGRVLDLNLFGIGPGALRGFLLEPQHGPREIAKRIFRAVSAHRSTAFSAAIAEPVTVPGAPVFPDVPSDPGHFPGPYYTHFLRGLRVSPPGYVTDLLEGQPVAPELASLLAGIVLITA